MVRETHPTVIFMVLGVPLEHEWLVPKLHLGTKVDGKPSMAGFGVAKLSLGTRHKKFRDSSLRCAPFRMTKIV
jgi:hypothetical protein